MATNVKLNDFIKLIEEKIEQRFGARAGYRDVKAMLEGKAEKTDVRSIIMDSRAVFSGDNKPQALAVKVMDLFTNEIDIATGGVKAAMDEKKAFIADNMEKNKAIIENRSSDIAYEVKEKEAVFSGRLVADEDIKPVAGAKVIVRGTGRAATKIIAETLTDANGEYVIKMDEETIKNAPKNITIFFETREGETITQTKAISMAKTTGKAEKIDITVPEEKKALTANLVKDKSVREYQAMVQLAELKKAESELRLFEFKTNKSANGLRNTFAGIKAEFEGAGIK